MRRAEGEDERRRVGKVERREEGGRSVCLTCEEAQSQDTLLPFKVPPP